MTTHTVAELERDTLARAVSQALADQPVTDLHTHCYPPAFGASPEPSGLLLWGIDELVTYHYLIAEVYRVVPASELPYEVYWKMTRKEQADHIWRHLFVERTPISEACRGVITTLSKLGLDPNEKTLDPYRAWFDDQTPDGYIDRVMEVANVDSITMTNEVFSDHERALWLNKPQVGADPRFSAVLRIDKLINDWPAAARLLAEWGYDVQPDFTGPTDAEVRRFLNDWLDRMKAIYVATSTLPGFMFPDPRHDERNRLIEKALMPTLAERGRPWALMIGSKRGVNPGLREAGDAGCKENIDAVVNLAAAFPDNKFMVTMLSRENQHELCVTARKFGNILPFGCWWFLNNPSLVEEVTRMRVELLGTSMSPQHSDARILDQLVYKWDHSRRVIAKVLTDKYADLIDSGYRLTPEHVQRDAALLLRDNFRRFVGK
jgi:hypothetical protein